MTPVLELSLWKRDSFSASIVKFSMCHSQMRFTTNRNKIDDNGNSVTFHLLLPVTLLVILESLSLKVKIYPIF